jgi:uncharacterized protein (TIGR01777 family)
LRQTIEGFPVIIKLAGTNIGQRWNASVKKELYTSRIETNQKLEKALARLKVKPKQILCASAIGIYPQRPCGSPLDESCTDVDDGFLGQLGQAWETSSLSLSPTPLLMRFGVVLGKNGGALAKMLPAFKLGLGGPVAGGQQCFSWVHIDDLCKAVLWALDHPELNGPINICAPHPLTQKEFGQTLAKQLHRPFGLPMPEWTLKLLFGEGAQVLTHSSCVLPTRLLEQGFKFEFPTAELALKDILTENRKP